MESVDKELTNIDALPKQVGERVLVTKISATLSIRGIGCHEYPSLKFMGVE